MNKTDLGFEILIVALVTTVMVLAKQFSTLPKDQKR